VLGGWSSGGSYPLLGSVRSSAQIISYELTMGLSLVTVFIMSGSMSTSQIVAAQGQLWYCVALLPSFLLYLVSMVGEVNRLPFDLPECEGELVAGYQTEYSSMKFAWYYLAEYINMINVSAIATTLFLGGWRAPWPLSALADGALNSGWWTPLWFLAKLWAVMFLFVWIRGTLVRFRYDQFMRLGWKRLLPMALVWIVVLTGVKAADTFSSIQFRSALVPLLSVFAVEFVAMGYWPDQRRNQAEREAAAEVPPAIDPFAGGYPVPPLPGQILVPAAQEAVQVVDAVAVDADNSGCSPEVGFFAAAGPSAGEVPGEVPGEAVSNDSEGGEA
jgi:NADH-quinone oxidoreductase subunit H